MTQDWGFITDKELTEDVESFQVSVRILDFSTNRSQKNHDECNPSLVFIVYWSIFWKGLYAITCKNKLGKKKKTTSLYVPASVTYIYIIERNKGTLSYILGMWFLSRNLRKTLAAWFSAHVSLSMSPSKHIKYAVLLPWPLTEAYFLYYYHHHHHRAPRSLDAY